jgi:nicotinamide-nucleotide amidase
MELIDAHGAVSEEVARAMAEGGLQRSNANITVSVTGIAGPGGGTETKPVGLIHFGCASKTKTTKACHEVFSGDRAAVREATVLQAFKMIETAIKS